MSAKLVAIPPEVPGAVVECGCFGGGSTANLSLVCDIVDRELIVCDSFEGMPARAGVARIIRNRKIRVTMPEVLKARRFRVDP